jgi:hypothetical protein
MNLSMVHSPDDQRFLLEREAPVELVSPELALVDPELAGRARERLPNPGEKEALARIAAQLGRTDQPTRPPATRAALRSPRRHRHTRWAAPVAVATALVTLLLLTDVRVEIGKTLASAGTASSVDPDTSAPEASVPETSVPAPRPTPTGQARRPVDTHRQAPQRTRPEPQRFAWAPSPGADGYHVELFRGDERIFASEARRPGITVPARWSFEGRSRTLGPGRYRWYVWSVTAGRRVPEAIVQAELTVPPR